MAEPADEERVGFSTGPTFTPKCAECANGVLQLRISRWEKKDGTISVRRFYGCSNWPTCRGVIGAHQAPPYKPLGTPADQETRKERIKVHDALDVHWKYRPKEERNHHRGKIYAWLTKKLNLTEYHTGECDKARCAEVLKLLEELPKELRYEGPIPKKRTRKPPEPETAPTYRPLASSEVDLD